jgi:hypothetical protein
LPNNETSPYSAGIGGGAVLPDGLHLFFMIIRRDHPGVPQNFADFTEIPATHHRNLPPFGVRPNTSHE